MQYIKTILSPLNFIISFVLKLTIRKLFFNNIDNKDFNNLFSYTLELIPNETFINIIKLLINILKSKPSDLSNFSVIKEVINHTIPSDNRIVIADKTNLFFIVIILSNIIKRIIKIIRNLIILPFKLGVYGFIFYLFGIKLDWLLSFFDVFKFNLPGWTYSKLIELHISWLNWIKTTLQVNSITTENEEVSNLPKFKRSQTNLETESDTFLFLTKKEWLIVTISIVFILGAYFGYTGGIPFSKTLEWNSDNRHDDDSNNNNGGDFRTQETNPWSKDIPLEDNTNTRQNSFTNLTTNIIEKLKKPFNWFRRETETNQEELEFWQQKQVEAEKTWKERLKFWQKEELDKEIKTGQLEKKGSLGELDREDVRREYVENKKSSPVHPDPESASDLDRLFPYASGSSSKPEENISMHQRNDSTDTITQETWRPRSRRIKASDDYLRENDQNIEERHTYPPRPSSIKPRRRALLTPPFSSLSGTSFARGVIEKLDTSKPQPIPEPPVAEPNPSVEIERGSILMSARFLDNFRDEWKD